MLRGTELSACPKFVLKERRRWRNEELAVLAVLALASCQAALRARTDRERKLAAGGVRGVRGVRGVASWRGSARGKRGAWPRAAARCPAVQGGAC